MNQQPTTLQPIPPLVPLAATICSIIAMIPFPGAAGIGNNVVLKLLQKYWGKEFGYNAITKPQKMKNLALNIASGLIILLLPKGFKKMQWKELYGRILAAVFNWFFVYFMAVRNMRTIESRSQRYY